MPYKDGYISRVKMGLETEYYPEYFEQLLEIIGQYPNPSFWEIAGEVGNSVIFGADAHQPEKVWNPEALSVAEKMTTDYGLNLTETVMLRKPIIKSRKHV